MTTVKVGGVVESIPDIWLAGFCTANKCGVREAVNYWLWQSELAHMDTDENARRAEAGETS